MRLLWWVVPEEWWPWIGAGLLVGCIVGAVRLQTALAAGAMVLAWPYIDAWLGGLPLWTQYALFGLLGLAFLRDLLAFFLGDRAADHAVGDFVGYLLRLGFRGLLFPLQLTTWAMRGIRGVLYRAERLP